MTAHSHSAAPLPLPGPANSICRYRALRLAVPGFGTPRRPTVLGRLAAVLAVTGLLFSPLAPLAWAAPPFSEFVDPNPNLGNQFGATVVALGTGNVVITSPFDDAGGTDAGAVYLFNGATGALISTLTGSTAGDKVGGGGVTALTNGNYVVRSSSWDAPGPIVNVGAVTWGNGTTGVSGVVSAANSLVGSSAGDSIGGGVTALTNGNYVVASQAWDNGTAVDAGAVTWGNGTTGTVGVVSAANSLVGSTAGDQIGIFVRPLPNGNYVVGSLFWDNGTVVDAGAATWGNGTTGIAGQVSVANSLVGSTLNDQVGIGPFELTNGNYVVVSLSWDSGAVADVGAVTWGDGTTGIIGPVTVANSLVGSTANDQVGGDGVWALTNGNYVVASRAWDNGAVVDVGAATWGNGTTGIIGPVTVANSLVGSTANDQVSIGRVTALTNGNYVVASGAWDNGATADVGAATWGNGTTGTIGVVSTSNSLVGSAPGDRVGLGSVALTNGNYVVLSRFWDGAAVDVGAATWGNGIAGISGPVTVANSLVGSTANDQVGHGGVRALTNGNYVVTSSNWDGVAADAGAATWGDGTTGITGQVSATNSLVGSTLNDRVGLGGVRALTNGNYVVLSRVWDGAAVDVGAVTWGNGGTGITGQVSAANSLVGSTLNDQVGGLLESAVALTNGNYVVATPGWDAPGPLADAGAVTLGGTTGASGVVNASNSLVGGVSGTTLQSIVVDNVNGTFFARFPNDGSGRVRVGSQVDVAFAPTIGVANPGNSTVSVAFTAPGSDGGSPITGYTATCTGAGGPYTGTGVGSPIVVTVPNGVAVTCTVHATNGIGNSGESLPSNSVTPTAGPVVNITGVPASAPEGSPTGTTNFVFTLSRTVPGTAFNVNYTITGDVVAPEDYVTLTGTVSFAAATTTRTITVAIRRDTKFEIDEDITLNLTGADNGAVIGGSFTATTQALNDDTPPTVSIGDRTLAESGATANFAVTLSNASYLPVTVVATTLDGTAKDENFGGLLPRDYTLRSDTVTFAPGVVSQNFGVSINNDTVYEGGSLGTPETYFVNLTNALQDGVTPLTITDNQGAGLITDNEVAPTVAIAASPNQSEVLPSYTFTITLNRQSQDPITIPAITQDGTTNSSGVPAFTGDPQDFIPYAGPALAFAAGETVKTIVLTVPADLLDEFNETFSLVLTNPVNVFNPGTLTRVATLNDDELAPTISITAPSPLNEGDGTATFTLALSGPSGKPISVTASTDPPVGTALSGTDYTATTVAFNTFPLIPNSTSGWGPGDTNSRFLDVPINGDALDEVDETFRAILSGAVNVTVATITATATILDDDNPPTISINNVSQAEGDAGATSFGFTVSLSAPSSKTITIRASTSNGTATTANSDYVPQSNILLTFSPLQTTQLFNVTVNGDAVLENDETFLVTLSSPNANVDFINGGPHQGLGTIQNDDSPALSIVDAQVVEGPSGQVSLNFDVTIPGAAPAGGVAFDFDTSDGTATLLDNDYDQVITGSGFISAGANSTQVTVLVNGDIDVEAHETLTVTISNATLPLFPVGIVTILDATATGTILNDDAIPTGALVISEFRLRGPNGPNDEFVEIANTTPFDITVYTANDLSSGFSVARAGGVQVFTIPNGTMIPARGHLLAVNTNGYSLQNYGGLNAATGNRTWTTDIPDNTGLALFPTASIGAYGASTPLDAVGFTAHEGTQYAEGAAPLSGEGLIQIGTGPVAHNYSFVRKHATGPGAAIQDTDNNKADFALVAVDAGTYGTTVATLGGPSPENLAAETERSNGGGKGLAMSGGGAVFTGSLGPVPAPAVKALEFRRTFTSTTTDPLAIVNALRFKVSAITTLNSPTPGVADLRPTGSSTVSTFQGLTLEGFPAAGYFLQTPAVGGYPAGTLPNGGLNSTWRVVTAPIGPGGTVDVNFRVEYTISGAPFLLWVVPEAKP